MLSFLFAAAVLSAYPGDVTAAAAVSAPVASPPTAVPVSAPFAEPLPTVLQALDAATDATARVAAVVALSSRRDARLIPLFEVLLREPDWLIARESVRALGQITDVTATRLLESAATESPSVVAELTFEALGNQQTFAAAEALNRLQNRTGLPTQRRAWATAAIQQYYGRYLEQFPARRIGSSAGRSAFVLASGEVAAIDLMAVGYFGLNPDIGAPLGFVSGAAIGLGAGYLLSRDRTISSVQGYRMLSYANWGALSGYILGAAAEEQYRLRHPGRAPAGLMALGSTAGYIIALYDDEELPTNRQMLADVSGVAGAAVGGGVLLWLPQTNDTMVPAVLISSTAIAGLAASRAALPKLQITNKDSAILFSTTALAAWYAPWTAYLMDTSGSHPERVWGWLLVGGGLGWYGGLTLAHYTEGTEDLVETADVFAVYGSLLGSGAMLAADGSKTARTGSMLLGGAGGFLLGALTADDFDLRPADEGLLLIGTLYGAFQGAGFAEYGGASIDQRRGWGFVGATAGASVALGASRVWDFTPALTGSILSGTGLGAWTAVLGGDRFGLKGHDLLLASLVGTNVGLAGTLVAVGPFDMAPERIAWAGVFGLGGAGISATGAALATSNRYVIESAALAGTAVGAVLGAILSPRFSPKSPDIAAQLPRLFAVQPWGQRLDGSTVPGLQVVMELD